MQDPAETLPFSALLRQLRLAAGLTQAALAERAGLSERTVQDLERDIGRPRRETARRLIAALAPSPDVRARFEAAISAPRPNVRRAPRDLRPVGGPNTLRIVNRSEEGAPAQPPDRTRLPMPLTSFVGRERELADILSLLGTNRLLTLTGPGGSGKTRLALEAARRVQPAFPDGSPFVSLAALSDPTLVPSSIAEALGVRETAGQPLLRTLQDVIGERVMLLVLDNFEHLLLAGSIVADLLAACPNLTVLVTSRELLRITGEQLYPTPPLSLPEGDGVSLTMGALIHRIGQSEAVQLFVVRAQTVRPGFELDGGAAPFVAEICARLDGLPLAIELAAARVRHLAPVALLSRLEPRLPVLTGGPRDAPARQQTLRDTIAWSFDLLNPREQALFRRTAVFVDGFSPEMSELVCDLDGDLGEDMLDLIGALVDQSLLRREDDRTEARVSMLETIREYGLIRLQASGEMVDVQRRHAESFLGLAMSMPMNAFQAQRIHFQRLDIDHGNFRAALSWSLAATPEIAQGVVPQSTTGPAVSVGARIASIMWRYWLIRGRFAEGRQWLGRLLESGRHLSTPVRAELLNGAGYLAYWQADFVSATHLLEEALEATRGLGATELVAEILCSLGFVARFRGDYDCARDILTRALQAASTGGHGGYIARSLQNLGVLATDQGDLANAATFLEKSATLFRQNESLAGVSLALRHLGHVSLLQGEVDRASQLLGESLEIAHSLGFEPAVIQTQSLLGWVAISQGDLDRAASLLAASLQGIRDEGYSIALAPCLEVIGLLAEGRGQHDRAAILFGAADAVREALSTPRPPSESMILAPSMASVRASMTDEDFAVRQSQGRAMTQAEAVAYALEQVPGD